MDKRVERSPVTIEYATSTTARRPIWKAGDRLRVGGFLAALHHLCGLVAIAALGDTALGDIAVLLFPFPAGLVAMLVNPHEMALAAIVNSVVCGFTMAYLISYLLNRKLSRP